MRRLLSVWLTVVVCFFVVVLGFMPYAISEDLSAVETTTFNQLPPFEHDGSWPSIEEVAQDTGYETARSWQAGEYPVDVLKVGDIAELHPGAFRLSELMSLDSISIADIGLISDLPLASLLKAIPFFGEWPVEQMPGIAEMLAQATGIDVQPTDTLNQAISKHPELG